MKIIAVIPARLEASRFPRKLLQPLGEQTVLLTTYYNVLSTQLFDEVFVATDSQEILEHVEEAGGKAIKTGVHETGSDRIAEAVKELQCDVVINVQGDEPFVRKEPLEQLISVFKEDPEELISLASLKMRLHDKEEIENPNNVKVITNKKGLALYFSRSVIPYPREESLEVEYFKHIGVYAFRKKALLAFASLEQTALELSEKIECLRYLENGMKIKMVETHFVGVGIDVPEDLEKARQILLKGPGNKS